MITDIEDFREKIRQYGLSRHEDKLLSIAKPSIVISREQVEESAIPIGASKLGGNPDLPASFEWKTYKGNPLTFIAQFKLSELTHLDTENILPERGILYFFYDTYQISLGEYEQREGWNIVFIADEKMPLVRTPHPTATGAFGTIKALPAHRIAYSPHFTLPGDIVDESNPYEIDFGGEIVRNVFPQELMSLWDMLRDTNPNPRHYLLGYPLLIQSSSEMGNSQFLFQIDTDDSLNVMWGDVGTLYIYIPKASLAQRKFEACWTMVEYY